MTFCRDSYLLTSAFTAAEFTDLLPPLIATRGPVDLQDTVCFSPSELQGPETLTPTAAAEEEKEEDGGCRTERVSLLTQTTNVSSRQLPLQVN